MNDSKEQNPNGKAPQTREEHVKQVKEQLERLEMQRFAMLGQVREIEQGMEYLRRHLGQMDEITKKATTDG